MDIVLLISGNLGLEALQYLYKDNKINVIATDAKSLGIIDFANKHKVPLFIGNPRNGRFVDLLAQFHCEVLFSINYLFLIEPQAINLFKYPINLHGSLLPRYRGRTPHVWAIINNESECGVTAHFIDKNCDAGDIILQEKVTIGRNDTGNDILLKYYDVYIKILQSLIEQIKTSNVSRLPQKNEEATYYGKRMPKDGEISWSWQKERIRNWVRALSDPYPGAFTYLNNEKIIIDWVEFDNLGFSYDMPDGYVLQSNPELVVKVPNGALRITRLRNNLVEINDGQILGS